MAVPEFLLEKEIMNHELVGKKHHFHNWYVQHNSKNTFFFFSFGLAQLGSFSIHPEKLIETFLRQFKCVLYSKRQNSTSGRNMWKNTRNKKCSSLIINNRKCIPLQNGKVTETRWHWFLRTKLEQETQSILLNGWHYPDSQCFPNQEEFKTSSFNALHFPSVPDYLPIRKALLHRPHRELENGGQKSSVAGIFFLHCFAFTLPCLH